MIAPLPQRIYRRPADASTAIMHFKSSSVCASVRVLCLETSGCLPPAARLVTPNPALAPHLYKTLGNIGNGDMEINN
jgi:hypothetical protein